MGIPRLCYSVLFLALAGADAWAQSDFRGLCGTTIRVGLRSDAPPFAFHKDKFAADSFGQCGPPRTDAPLKDHVGYTVELCRGFLEAVARDCRGNPPNIVPVEVPIAGRYDMLAADEPPFDLLCGATTATVTLRAELPVSPYTFLTGTSVLGGPRFLDDTGCRVGVIGGTTSDATSTATDKVERRLPGWESFTEGRASCDPRALEDGLVYTYPDTTTAIIDLLSDGSKSKADLLLEDRHILQWHLANLTALPGKVNRLPGEDPIPFENLAAEDIRAIQRRMMLLPDIITIEPYAVVGPRGSSQVVAQFSRYLTRIQGDPGYTQLLRQCFGRQVDRSFWFLVEFQSNVREGDFLPDPKRTVQ